MGDIIVVVVAIGLIIIFFIISRNKKKMKERQEAEQAALMAAIEEKEQAVAAIAMKVQAELNNVESQQGATARANHCKRALGLLHSTKKYWPIYKEVIENYDELEARLGAMQKVFPVIDHIERAYKARFKGNASSELNALTDALYAVQTGQVSNDDLIRAEIFPEGALGEVVQIEDIINRAKELGWEGPKDGSAIIS
ncbi:hypothetical protein ACFL07_01280 [Pseudomonadota bacterium]